MPRLIQKMALAVLIFSSEGFDLNLKEVVKIRSSVLLAENLVEKFYFLKVPFPPLKFLN